jgi:outer membrane protein assembly factor BamB
MRENPQMRIQEVRQKKALLFFIFMALVATAAVQGAVNVTQYHNHENRDGLYIDPAFTRAAAAGLKRDTNFLGAVSGNIYAQPLYIEDGPAGKAMVITLTESNNVYALDAANGTVLWQQHVGQPVPRANFLCGNIDPMGITGTPVVDLPSRTLFFDAMTTPDGGTTKQHLFFALNVDTGTTNAGWPVDLNATVTFGTNIFNSAVQGERSALALLNGYVYSTYGGNAGDCGNYFGWIVAIPAQNPSTVQAWATSIRGGGAWSVGGLASDGVDLFMATGNTFGAGGTWSGGESIIRFNGGAHFSGQTNDFWTPTNWPSLDMTDRDLGGSGALIVDVPGATPSQLILALGKDGGAYLLNRTNLGGIGAPVYQRNVSSGSIIQAAVTYQTTQGVYVVLCANTQLAAYRITPTSPPTMVSAWTVNQNGRGSPFVTSTDGSNNVVVWGIGAGTGTGIDQRLHGFDGDTGAVVFNGGAANELMAATHAFQTAIAARGRIFVATDRKIYAFAVPAFQPVIVLSNPTLLPDGSFQFDFTNIPGMGFSVFRSTNLSLPLTNWTLLGPMTENPPGQFRFIDPPADLDGPRLYRVRTP